MWVGGRSPSAHEMRQRHQSVAAGGDCRSATIEQGESGSPGGGCETRPNNSNPECLAIPCKQSAAGQDVGGPRNRAPSASASKCGPAAAVSSGRVVRVSRPVVPNEIMASPGVTAPHPTIVGKVSPVPAITGVPGRRPVARAAAGVTPPTTSVATRRGGSSPASNPNAAHAETSHAFRRRRRRRRRCWQCRNPSRARR